MSDDVRDFIEISPVDYFASPEMSSIALSEAMFSSEKKAPLTLIENKNGGAGKYNSFEQRKALKNHPEIRAAKAFRDYKKMREEQLGEEWKKEVPMRCSSYDEALNRVVELVGFVPQAERRILRARFPEELQGYIIGYQGAFKDGTQVQWYIDHHPEIPEKSSHFNVLITPPSARKNGNEALNIYFSYPKFPLQKGSESGLWIPCSEDDHKRRVMNLHKDMQNRVFAPEEGEVR